jgi:serine/threonine protein phosphatase PrpC
MPITTASRTDVGRLRSHNEDDCGVFRSGPGHTLLVVADGMGGHRGGATASHMAVETIGRVFQDQATAAKLDDPAQLLERAFDEANAAIYQASLDDASLRGMGTTVVALLWTVEGGVWVAHVGDSRAYRLRGKELEALTEDHSLVAELQRRGLISAEEALVHPRRNEILRSIGVLPAVETAVRSVDVTQGDRFALCSDGLSGVVRDPEIAEVLVSESPDHAVKTLIDRANQYGGPDNITVQVAAID